MVRKTAEEAEKLVCGGEVQLRWISFSFSTSQKWARAFDKTFQK
jgi:hypothetical protein